MSGQCLFFHPSSSLIQISPSAVVSTGAGLVYLTSHCRCLYLSFQKGSKSPWLTSPLLSIREFWPSQLSLFSRPPLISSCFGRPLAAPDIVRCAEGMLLPEEFPHLPPLPVPNFTLTNWPRIPLPVTSLFSPLGPVHEMTDLVHKTVQGAVRWTSTSWGNSVQK